MGQGEILFTARRYPFSLSVYTKGNGFKEREQEKHTSDWSAASVPMTLTRAVKMLHLVPVPEPLQHRAKPVLPARLTGLSKGKKIAIPTQPKGLVVLDCNCPQNVPAGSGFSNKVESHR